jgi:hypothetical protein
MFIISEVIMLPSSRGRGGLTVRDGWNGRIAENAASVRNPTLAASATSQFSFGSPLARFAIGLVLIAIAPVWCTAARAGDPGASGADPAVAATAAAAESATRLVPQLGSEFFSVREATTNQLMQMGIEIKPVLVAARDDADPEIRVRARRVLASVVDADFQHRLALFAEDVNDAKHYELPGWSRFRKLVGADRAARNLFVEMQRAESGLMVAFEEGHDATARMLETRIRVAQAAFQGRFGPVGNLSLGNVAALLFVASDKDVKLSEDYASMLGNLPYHQSFQQPITSGAQAELLRKILGAWIARDASQNLSFQNLYLAMRFNLKEGLDPAVRLLQQPGVIPQVKSIALLTIARFGGKEHLRIVEPFLNGTELCTQIDVNGTRYMTQVRDVALFASLRLAEQEPKNFGFTRVPPNEQIFTQVANLGFKSASERDEAFKKWSDWRAANLQSRDATKPAASKS